MTTEEIIQRLLDEKKITVKESLTILKDVVKNEVIYRTESTKDIPYSSITVMYGTSPVVSTNSNTNNNNKTYSTND